MSVFVNPDSLISQLNLKGDEVVVNFGSGSGFPCIEQSEVKSSEEENSNSGEGESSIKTP